MRKVALTLALVAVVGLAANAFAGGSRNHNTGLPSCGGCHVPHMAANNDPANPQIYGVPLWSNANFKGLDNLNSAGDPDPDSAPGTLILQYDLYQGSRKFQNLGLQAEMAQPVGPTLLCLGCHDGSVTHRAEQPFNEATSMTKSHPMGMQYTAALAAKPEAGGALENPDVKLSGLGGTITQDLLDDQQRVACTSCHEPHVSAVDNENAVGHMKYALNGTLCATCHNK